MLVFGGKNQYRQISEVTTIENRATCVLRNIGQLPFDYTMGACTESDNELFLCFDSGTPYACYRTHDIELDELSWFKLADSGFHHERIRISASSENLIAVGSDLPSHAHTELLDRRSLNWISGPDYPFSKTLNGFSIVTVSDYFVLFGGQITSADASKIETDIVAQYKDSKWTQIGSLQKPRMGHAVIRRYRDEYWVVGGTKNDPIESCTLTVLGQFICKSFITGLARYEFYPELFLMDTKQCL